MFINFITVLKCFHKWSTSKIHKNNMFISQFWFNISSFIISLLIICTSCEWIITTNLHINLFGQFALEMLSIVINSSLLTYSINNKFIIKIIPNSTSTFIIYVVRLSIFIIRQITLSKWINYSQINTISLWKYVLIWLWCHINSLTFLLLLCHKSL